MLYNPRPSRGDIMRATDINTNQYEVQLTQKVEHVQESFTHLPMPELEVFDSPKINYRMRAEFRIWHDGEDLYHIMFDQETKEKYRIDQFPQASKLINLAMSNLIPAIKDNSVLRSKLFQVDYLSTLSGELIISLLYHKQLNEDWVSEAELLSQSIIPLQKINIIGRARKQKHIIGNDFINERLPIGDKTYTFKQIENSFTQPNAAVNCKMIEWAIKASKATAQKSDLLELYCGLGNFTIPLAANFKQVLATEISKSSVSAANDNLHSNNIKNTSVVRISSEEFTQAIKGERKFRRLKDTDLTAYHFETIFVDPPRSGLDEETLNMVKHYRNIIYISCNPTTLLDNLNTLCKTHYVTRFALFDQFPYTHHVECGVYLEKK
jgi:tRNA (uracil-5-)-methyltransferase